MMASFGSAKSLWLDEKGTMYLTSCLKLHVDLYMSIDPGSQTNLLWAREEMKVFREESEKIKMLRNAPWG